MPRDFLKNARPHYDVVVVGSGLGGMTAANVLARSGRSVLLLEQHYKLGGMATWFKRPGGHIFDVSLHGFPYGMVKSCRRYWTQEIADAIVPLQRLRFDNPMFSLTTSYDRQDFTRLLVDRFDVPADTVHEFFDTVRKMNFYDDQTTTTGQLFERFFPGRNDVVRLLMEPIVYANGSTLEDPAITYGIVFSNFMAKGVYTYQGGTDQLVQLMQAEMARNGVDARIRCQVDGVQVRHGHVAGVHVNGKSIATDAVVSNANLMTTIFKFVGAQCFERDFVDDARAVRLNNSSTQVYMALKAEEQLDESTGDLLFSSTAREFRTDLLLSRDITSRTYSFYYPRTRPQGRARCLIVSSTNAHYDDWSKLSPEQYEFSKQHLIDTTLSAVEMYVPRIRERLAHVEAATPLTFEHYTQHVQGASFGTKFEGLPVSRGLPAQVAGLYHAGSVGIIMSGWLGAINYGVIVSNDVDAYLMKRAAREQIPQFHKQPVMTLAEIQAAIPHRPPMLLIDEVVSRDTARIHCRKQFREDEFFFQGHYPGHPLVPGVILCEAGMQAGAVLLSALIDDSDGKVPVATRLNDVKFKRMIRPGETVEIDVELCEQVSTAFFLRAKVTCDGKLAVRFAFACTMAEAA